MVSFGKLKVVRVGEFWVRMYFVGYFVDRFEGFRFKIMCG